jgi:hypothetical protein
MPAANTQHPVLAYASKANRRWRRWVAALVFSIAAFIAFKERASIHDFYHARMTIYTQYRAERACPRFDPAKLPVVLLSHYDGAASRIVGSKGLMRNLIPEYSSLDIARLDCLPLEWRVNWVISSGPNDGHLQLDSTLILHESARPDGATRLVLAEVNGGWLSACSWFVGTPFTASPEANAGSGWMEISLPHGQTMSLHGMIDPLDSKHLQLRAILSGSPASVGTIDVVVRADDSIDFRPSFGAVTVRREIENHRDVKTWYPGGKPSDRHGALR